MENLNLILKFKLAEDAEVQVKGAVRIKIEKDELIIEYGKGGLDRINFAQLHSLAIQGIACSPPVALSIGAGG